jgi:hypothetical protein
MEKASQLPEISGTSSFYYQRLGAGCLHCQRYLEITLSTPEISGDSSVKTRDIWRCLKIIP